MGMKELEFKQKATTVTYDLMQLTEAQIEAALSEAGVVLGQAWMECLKRAWVDHIEQNELDNLASGSAACCNRARPRS